ncbi:MAG: nucleoside hydrolase [Gammaproteobacteria bacterium]|nr:nucleoside hydrolase [Gammaproteobacteria bacterium]
MKKPIPVLVDTDANNELDDQHALAYALLNQSDFKVVGVTVNNTPNGGGIEGQYREAERVIRLCDRFDDVRVFRGVEASLGDVLPNLSEPKHDGYQAVDFIIESAQADRSQKLVVIAIGKLTNVALALAKSPGIAKKIRLVWLGSNFPHEGEYNLWSDPDAVNYVIKTDVDFELVTVRYRETTGATAVSVDGSEIVERMTGKGKTVAPVVGRHGGKFTTFGDYSVSLFENVNFSRRPLFDVVAVAIVKNPAWGNYRQISGQKLEGIRWVVQQDSNRTMGLWEEFDRDEIIEDFFHTFESEP